MRSAFALRIISGKIILNFAFVALCGALQTHFHGRGRKGKRHLQRRFLRKRGAAGKFFASFQRAEPSQSRLTACQLPRKGRLLAVVGKFLVAFDTLVTALTACALSVIATRCQIPPFVAARHLPPERGKSFLKGRAKSTPGSFLIALKTSATSLRPWLPLRGSWRGSA